MNLEELLSPYSPPETNFLERLRYWSIAQPESIAYRFLEGGEEVSDTLTFGQLDRNARAIAAQLVSMGFAGQRALMMYDPGLEFVTAFFACHYAGVVPVPAYPPPRNRKMGRINAIAENAKASIVLTTSKILKRLEDRKGNSKDESNGFSDRLNLMPWIAT
ncbi:MAG: AMP-binding protein, partial [Mariniblastus sp.]|nr:AMP-binding protein [Mariniblastus sp.]